MFPEQSPQGTMVSSIDEEDCRVPDQPQPEAKAPCSDATPPDSSTAAVPLMNRLLPFLPDPTRSVDERRRYITNVLPLALASALAPVGPVYGFNVWLLPLSMELYGADATYTMRNGMVLYAFSSVSIPTAVIIFALSAQLVRWPTWRVLLASGLLYAAGLALSGLSLTYKSEAGLFLSQFFLCGTALALFGFPMLIRVVTFYREIGRPSVGAGIFGALAGFWPMIFSYWGGALANSDPTTSFYYTALIGFVLQVPSFFLLRSPAELPPPPAGEPDGSAPTLPYVSDAGKDSASAPSSEDLSKKTGFREGVLPKFTNAQLNRDPKAWVEFLVWFATFIPGFAIKFTISPVMSSLFHASLTLQSTVSFIFLALYAVARLAAGLIVGPRVSLRTVVLSLTAFAPLCFFLNGAIAYSGGTDLVWMWVFVAGIAGIGCTLGAMKVMMSLVSLANWGVNNVAALTARASAAAALAAFVGPIVMWYGLSRSGTIYLDPELNTTVVQEQVLQRYAGISILVLGGISSVGFLGFCFFMNPHPLSSAAPSSARASF